MKRKIITSRGCFWNLYRIMVKKLQLWMIPTALKPWKQWQEHSGRGWIAILIQSKTSCILFAKVGLRRENRSGEGWSSPTLQQLQPDWPPEVAQPLWEGGSKTDEGRSTLEGWQVVRAENPPVYQNRRPHNLILAIYDNARSARWCKVSQNAVAVPIERI